MLSLQPVPWLLVMSIFPLAARFRKGRWGSCSRCGGTCRVLVKVLLLLLLLLQLLLLLIPSFLSSSSLFVALTLPHTSQSMCLSGLSLPSRGGGGVAMPPAAQILCRLEGRGRGEKG